MNITTEKVTLKNGKPSVIYPFPNTEGRIIGAFLTIANESDLPTGIVRASLKDTGGNELIPFLDVREWKRRTGGSFMESMISPLNINKSHLRFEIQANENAGADVVFDLALVHEPLQNPNEPCFQNQ